MPAPRIRIINAPFDLCGRRTGSRLGPAAVHLAELRESLGDLGIDIDAKDGGWGLEDSLPRGIVQNAEESYKKCSLLKSEVAGAIAEGMIPLVIGGDHSLSVGSISGALAAHGSDLGALWVDAHMDLNTPDVSTSKNFHGMPVAALLRLQEKTDTDLTAVWLDLLDHVVPKPGLRRDAVSWFALRDVDVPEAANLRTLEGALAQTMSDIDRNGIGVSVEALRTWIRLRGIKKLWISFDVDSLDPLFAPGTGTAVRGGLTYREGHFLAECLHQMVFGPDRVCDLAGLDVVEVNPLMDRENETARNAVGWVSSLFGKNILRSPLHAEAGR